MKKFVYFFFLSIILLLSSCASPTSNDAPTTVADELPYDQQVFYQIFPAIFDSLRVASYLVTPPPPSIPDYQYYNDSIEYKKAIYEHDELLKKIEQDTTDPIIAISDTAYYNKAQATYYGLSKKKKSTSQESFKIDIEKLLVQADTFQLVCFAKVPPNNSYKLNNKFKKRVKILLTLSTVYFDSNKTSGFLAWSLSCGPLCGQGGRIFIKNINGKWVVVNVVVTSVS